MRGDIKSLGADAQIEPMTDADFAAINGLLAAAGLQHDPATSSAWHRLAALYHWNADADQEY